LHTKGTTTEPFTSSFFSIIQYYVYRPGGKKKLKKWVRFKSYPSHPPHLLDRPGKGRGKETKGKRRKRLPIELYYHFLPPVPVVGEKKRRCKKRKTPTPLISAARREEEGERGKTTSDEEKERQRPFLILKSLR